MDYERFKEDFQDALKDVLAGRGADVEVESRRVEKMNDSYDAITVKPVDSAIGVNISIEKAYSEYEKGTDIAEIADHFADAVENGLRESPQFDLDSISDYEQMKSKLSMEVVSAERNADFLQNVPHEKMKEKKLSNKKLADASLVGERTIQRLKNEEEYPTTIQTVLGLCYGLQLSVPEAEMLVGKTDFNIKPTNPQNNAYRCVLSSCAENSIYEVNEMLESCGFEPLGSSKLG